jgi:VanZ family protein
VYWLLLFTVTHVPRLPKPPGPPLIDKVAHFIAYAGLAILCLVYLRLKGPLTAATYVKLLAVLAPYAALDELLQIPVGRSAELFDWFADVAGALIGMSAVAVVCLALQYRCSAHR